MVFSSSHVLMWELDHKESWAPKNWCFWTVVLEKTLESSLDCKEIKPVNPKGNQPWIFIRRTDAEAPILWLPDAKSQLIRKDPDAGKDWTEEEKGTTEDKMVGWSLSKLQEDGEGQRSLACFSPWGRRVRHNWVTEKNNNKPPSLDHFLLCRALYHWMPQSDDTEFCEGNEEMGPGLEGFLPHGDLTLRS